MSHERTFLALLAKLGVAAADAEGRARWPEVRAFNTTLAGLCALDDAYTALAALGVVEDLFAEVAPAIGRAIVARGWLAADDVPHYPTHERLDVLHAEGFYRQLDGPYAAHARSAYQIQQGLELGAYAFLRLDEDLYRARARRTRRAIGSPHSLADGWYLDPGLGAAPTSSGP